MIWNEPRGATVFGIDLGKNIFHVVGTNDSGNIVQRVRFRRETLLAFFLRDKEHRRFVARQPCLVCGRVPSDPHHLRFAQPRALGRRLSDEFTVPLCRTHHRELHRRGDEPAWWNGINIDPIPIALKLWRETHLDVRQI